ncbi:hypothetical protein SEVIR_7G026052v4 [Setaria viridis]
MKLWRRRWPRRTWRRRTSPRSQGRRGGCLDAGRFACAELLECSGSGRRQQL